YSSQARYSGPGKLALMVIVKGLRDPSGNPATGTFTLRTGASRVTIIGLTGTIGETSPLAQEQPYSVPVKNGSAKAAFDVPDVTPKSGLVVNSLTAPVLYDPDDHPLATTGTQEKP